MSYLLLGIMLALPFLLVLLILTTQRIAKALFGDQSAAYMWFDSREAHQMLEPILLATVGLNLEWVFDRASGVVPVRPFHKSAFSPILVASFGLVYLILARLVVVRRAVPLPKHRIRRLFQWLDRTFSRLNARFARGIVLALSGNNLPEENPVAWRENRRGNLGRLNYLIRILLVIEFPILLLTALLAAIGRGLDFSVYSGLALVLWSIAVLVVVVRSAGLFAAEKARQTLDVLLTTPLLLWDLVGAKMRGLLRVMALVSVPILCHNYFVSWLQAETGNRRSTYSAIPDQSPTSAAIAYAIVSTVNLAILLALASQLAFLCGLRAKTQGRAVTTALGLFLAWSCIPLFVRVFAETPAGTLYLSPIGGLLVNEFPALGVDFVNYSARYGTGQPSYGFVHVVHGILYAALAAGLFLVNLRVAARALFRSDRPSQVGDQDRRTRARGPFSGPFSGQLAR